MARSNINKIKSKVPEYLWDDVFEYVYDVLANSINVHDVAADVDGYDPDWCEVEGYSGISVEVESLVYDCAEGVTAELFSDYDV